MLHLKQTGYRGSELSYLAALYRPFSRSFFKDPLTAADENLPLSVVRVNKKPQHIVFCLHSLHQASKQRHLAVESSQRPDQERVSAS
jgi:hypothetical protein